MGSLGRLLREQRGMEFVEWALVGGLFALVGSSGFSSLSGAIDTSLAAAGAGLSSRAAVDAPMSPGGRALALQAPPAPPAIAPALRPAPPAIAPALRPAPPPIAAALPSAPLAARGADASVTTSQSITAGRTGARASKASRSPPEERSVRVV
jgi:Flp pilus assembly pilin Flp